MVILGTGAISDITAGTAQAEKALILDKSKKIDEVDMATLKIGGVDKSSVVISEEVTFTETGAGTYTGSVSVPANATILDVLVHAVALWDAATSALMDVGDVADPNGFLAAVDLKATDLLAGESISQGLTGGKEGADWDGGETAGDASRRRFLSTARVVSGIIVSVGAGTLGRTRMTVVYSLPKTPVAATKV